MQLLSIDFDYFFPIPQEDGTALYDWGHREAPFFIGQIWDIRASAFIARDMPLPHVNDEWVTFWDQIQLAPKANLYVAESHAFAVDQHIISLMNKSGDQSTIWSFDAHHDLGYSDNASLSVMQGNIDCGSWLLYYHMRFLPKIYVRYPSWKRHAFEFEPDTGVSDYFYPENIDRAILSPDDNLDHLPIFDHVFVCRSGAWVPPWCDNDFFAFIAKCPTQRMTFLDHSFPLKNRLWNDDDAKMYAEGTRSAMVSMQAEHGETKPTT